MTDQTAFFYGTLMAPQVLHRVIYGMPSSTISKHASPGLTTTPAILSLHRRHRVLQADYPAILPNPNSTVRGTYVTGLSSADIWRLDIFEGDEYKRSPVTVTLLPEDSNTSTTDSNATSETTSDANTSTEEKGEPKKEVQTQTYIWIGGAHRLEDQEWDFSAFQREKMWRWTGQSAEGEGEYAGESAPTYQRVYVAVEYEDSSSDEEDAEVDEAVKEAGTDGTGGRGGDGFIARALEEVRGKDLDVDGEVESAV